MIQFLDFASVARSHEPLQAVARNGDYVVEIRNTRDGQSLAAANSYFGWELTGRPGNERDYDSTDVIENGIPGQDHDRSATDWRGQFGPPDLPTLHASSAFQSGTFGSSPSSAVCVSATWVASRSVMAAESRYCRTASSTSVRTSRPCFAARLRSCSSTLPGSSMLMTR